MFKRYRRASLWLVVTDSDSGLTERKSANVLDLTEEIRRSGPSGGPSGARTTNLLIKSRVTYAKIVIESRRGGHLEGDLKN